MTNRKKAVTAPSAAEVKRYGVSAGEMLPSPPEANPSSSSNVKSLGGEPSPSTDRSPRITEQRRARRFQVCTPATIRWPGSGDEVNEAVGIVRDISTCGIYVEAALSLGTNDNVELEIVPFGLRHEHSNTELHFEGKVVRSEPRASRPGFAVAGFLWLAKSERQVC
jgi:hypothetical protein